MDCSEGKVPGEFGPDSAHFEEDDSGQDVTTFQETTLCSSSCHKIDDGRWNEERVMCLAMTIIETGADPNISVKPCGVREVIQEY